METILRTPSSSILSSISLSSQKLHICVNGGRLKSNFSLKKSHVSCRSYNEERALRLEYKEWKSCQASSCSANSRRISSLESLFCYDKPVPEQIIEKPVGLAVDVKEIGDHARCSDCQAKGAVLCTTCGGSGLYVDSVMECQGIIVKVRCLGCGGTGNIMCSECGGRGHM